MVISNIGTIVQSLAPRVALHSLSTSSVSTQVRLISISNTASRLISGTLADRVSPPPHHLPTGYIVFFRKRYVSRVVFVFTACTLLFVSFFWMATAVQTQRGVWVLSVGTGASYGMMWTIVPGLVSSMWGARNAARNFGAISYAPFVGTPLFTYLYAYISDRGRGVGDGGAICEGTHCWRDTFVVCAGAACLATLTSVGLWRKFKSQL
jgi:MFS family permease